MQRVSLDHAPPMVTKFLRSLPIEPLGVELELNGSVLCKVLGPQQFTESERVELVKRGRAVLKKANARNRGVSSRSVERDVEKAIEQVRQRKMS